MQPRATKDLDLLLGDSGDNLARAARALARYGAPANVIEAVARLGPDEVAYLGEPPLRVDLLRAIDGVSTPDVLRGAVDTTWDGVPVRVISLADLIDNKRAAGRAQDRVDVERLEKVRAGRAE